EDAKRLFDLGKLPGDFDLAAAGHDVHAERVADDAGVAVAGAEEADDVVSVFYRERFVDAGHESPFGRRGNAKRKTEKLKPNAERQKENNKNGPTRGAVFLFPFGVRR